MSQCCLYMCCDIVWDAWSQQRFAAAQERAFKLHSSYATGCTAHAWFVMVGPNSLRLAGDVDAADLASARAVCRHWRAVGLSAVTRAEPAMPSTDVAKNIAACPSLLHLDLTRVIGGVNMATLQQLPAACPLLTHLHLGAWMCVACTTAMLQCVQTCSR